MSGVARAMLLGGNMPLLLRDWRGSSDTQIDGLSFAKLHEGPYLADTIPSNTSTWATVGAPGTFYGEIETIGDQDWIKITLQAGVSYTIALNSQGGSTGLSDPYLAIYDSTGTLITLDDDSGPGFNALIVFTPTTSGTYYLGASGIPTYTGFYALVVNGGGADPIAGTTSTTSSLVIDDATASSSIETIGDQDWFRVNLVAGESYAFTLNGSGASPLGDAFLRLYDASGMLVSIDDDGGAGLNSMMQFTAATTGVYYLAAGGNSSSIGTYTLGAAHGPPQNPLDTIDLGFSFNTMTIDIFFAADGTSYGPIGPANSGWTSTERNAVLSALQTIANVTNLVFNEVTNAANADIIFMQSDLSTGVLGQTFPSPSIGYIEFSPSAAGWNTSGLSPGGLGYSTIIHEVLHALGLEHPHLDGGESQVMQGVISAFNSYGTFGLNQQVFTIMSYNDGWPMGPAGEPVGYGAGYAATPMALDIAFLQLLYGADPARNQTDTTYALSDATTHSAYRAIWDTGGIDIISYDGSSNAVINLNAATLLNQTGGGGFVSYAGAVLGGYTIASGVVIENASGGSGNDEITGNAIANLLSGGAGADVLRGNDGNDRLEGGDGVDQMFGGAGQDTIIWDAADDLANVQGGDGADLLVFFGGATPTSFDLTAHGFEAAEGRFTDTGGQSWTTQVDIYDALWRLNRTVVTNDNGTSSTLDYDVSNTAAWTTAYVAYDELARADVDATLYDDNTRAVLDYDQGNAFNWLTTWASYNAADQLDTDVLTYDDNSHAVRDFDQNNAFDWQVTWASYLPNGVLDIDVFTYDDGSTAVRDLDQGDAFDWDTSWASYDSLNRLDTDVITYDDGSRAVRDIDQANDFAWAEMWWLFDSNGALVAFQGTNDDGSFFYGGG